MSVALLLCVSLPSGTQVQASENAGIVTVSGNQFLLNGAPFVPHGFNSIALLNSSWCTESHTKKAADSFTTAELDIARTVWNANTLRFQVSQPVLAGQNGVAYAQQIQASVAVALAAGFVVDVSMQDQSRACGNADPLPGQETKAAWTTLLLNTSLGTNRAVMLELFNEPQNSALTTPSTDPLQYTWVDWLDGGREIAPSSTSSWTAYTPLGHQDLVNYLRSSLQATNVLIVDGARKSEHLEGVPVLSDPGGSYQIAYGVHPYFYTDGPVNWDIRWGNLASTNAVIATEWNYTASACGTVAKTMAPQFLTYMRTTIHVGILGHSLDSFDDLTGDGSLTPTRCGAAIQGAGTDFLQMYMATFSPSTPTTPTALVATPSGAHRIDVSWVAATDDTGIAGYFIYRDGLLLAQTTATTYSDIDLASQTEHRYTVASYDSTGNTSPQTQPVAATTGTPVPPTAPTGLAATAVSGSQVDLRWVASVAAEGTVAGYSISRNGSPLTTVNGTSYSDLSVSDASTYSYSVDAVDTFGQSSAPSTSVSVSTPDARAPTVPAGLKLTVGAKSVTLSWTASTDNVGVAGYQIYRNGVPLIKTLQLTYLDSGLVQGTSYRYAISAYDAIGNTSLASASQSMILPDTTKPTQPITLTLTPTKTSIALKWTASADNVGVAGYRIYRSSTLIATVGGKVTAYVNTGLKSKTVYNYHVVAFDAAGNVSTAGPTRSTRTQ